MISVRTSYFSGAASNPSIYLSRDNPVTALGAVLVDRSIVDDSGTRAYVNDVVQADRRLVNNALYTYTYRVCVGSADVFYGARITYQYYSAGD